MERSGAGFASVRGDERRALDPAEARGVASIENPLIPFRATTVSEALDLGFQLLRSRFGILAGLTATLYLPVQLLDLILRLTVAQGAVKANQASVVFGVAGVGGGSGWTLLPFILQRVAQSMLGIACGFLVMAMIRGETPGYRTLLLFTLKRFWAAIAIVIAVGVLMGVGAIAAILGVLVLAMWTFATSVVCGAERLGPFASIGRCLSLSRANSGVALAAYLGIVVVTLLIRAITSVGPTVLLGSLGMPETVRVLVEQLSMMLLLIVPLLTSCLAATAYLCMRTRSEGLDLLYRMSERLGANSVF